MILKFQSIRDIMLFIFVVSVMKEEYLTIPLSANYGSFTEKKKKYLMVMHLDFIFFLMFCWMN